MVFFILTVSLLLYYLIFHVRKGSAIYNKCNLKGPPGLPFIGNGLTLLRNFRAPMRQYTQWAQQYGSLFKVKVGTQPAIVVSDIKALNKIFAKFGQKCHYRPRGTVLSTVMGNKGLVTSDGGVWLQHRRFTVKAMQELKIGQEHERIFSQVKMLCEKIKNGLTLDQFDPVAEIGISLFDLMWEYFGSENAGERHRDQVRKFLEESPAEMQVAECGGVWNFSVPLQLFWILWNNPVKLLISTVRKSLFIRNQISSEVQAREGKGQGSSQSLLSLYMDEMESTEKDQRYPEFAETQLRAYLGDLIAAGVDTTFTTIRWIFLLLAKHPEVSKKLTDELNDALSRTSLAELTRYSKRHELPYLEAVILETLRFRPTIHTILHTSRDDVNFNHEGQPICIPKDCWIIGNIWGAHFDENRWSGNPNEFNPDRFLDSNGRVRREEADKCIPFSIGVRSCPGEFLAKVSLHAFNVGLLSQFSVQMLSGYDCSIEPTVGVSLIPPSCSGKLILTYPVEDLRPKDEESY